MGPVVLSPQQAALLLENGDTLLIGGSGGGLATPEALLAAIGERFRSSGQPAGVTAIHPVGCGDWGARGASHLAQPGLLKRQITGSLSNSAASIDLALRNEIEAYTLPQGVLSQLCRDIAGGRPGLITHVGLGTCVDPRYGGGRQSGTGTGDELVRLIELDGHEYLFYRAFQVDIALIRGTTADEDGNLTMEREPFVGEMLAMAQAAHNCGGLVIAQVERRCARGSLPPREVRVPGFLIDAVVVDAEQWQTYAVRYNPGYSGELRVTLADHPPLVLDERKVIARRAALELIPGQVVNLGFGVANGIADVLAEEDAAADVILTVEQGLIGGIPAIGHDAGAGVNFAAMIEQPAQFDFYDGGGLDMAFLSFAEVDPRGTVNVSRFGGRINGFGGFINISQNAQSVRFLGTLTAGGLMVDVADGRLRIVREGRIQRFVPAVEQVTYDAVRGLGRGQAVRFITERAVLDLDREGLIVREIAPGVDLEHDVLAHFAVRPRVDSRLSRMVAEIFRPEPMGLRASLAARQGHLRHPRVQALGGVP